MDKEPSALLHNIPSMEFVPMVIAMNPKQVKAHHDEMERIFFELLEVRRTMNGGIRNPRFTRKGAWQWFLENHKDKIATYHRYCMTRGVADGDRYVRSLWDKAYPTSKPGRKKTKYTDAKLRAVANTLALAVLDQPTPSTSKRTNGSKANGAAATA